MENLNGAENTADRKTGGLYSKVKMSVKTANIMVAVLVTVLVAATVFIVKHSGFTVKFDTNGGSAVSSVKLKYSDTVPETENPVKEGYSFSGWYTDPDLKAKWEPEDTVTGSMTLYAKWDKN